MSLPQPDLTNPFLDQRGTLVPFWKKWFIDLHKQLNSLGSGGSGGTTSPLSTKGDLWGYDSGNARVPVGSNGQVLTADSSVPTGVKWAAAAGGGGGGYTTGTFVATLIGCTSAPTVTVQYLIANNMCCLSLDSASLLGIALGGTAVGINGIPVNCRPASYHSVACGPVMNNNVFTVGFAYGMNSPAMFFDTIGGVSWNGMAGLGLGWTVIYPLT